MKLYEAVIILVLVFMAVLCFNFGNQIGEWFNSQFREVIRVMGGN